jgi:hypothetical protein
MHRIKWTLSLSGHAPCRITCHGRFLLRITAGSSSEDCSASQAAAGAAATAGAARFLLLNVMLCHVARNVRKCVC